MNLDKTRKYLENKKTDYWDLREGTNEATSIKIENGKIEKIKQWHSEGIGVRVIKDGSAGFSHTEDKEEIEKTCKRAYKTAKALENQGVNISEEEIHRDQYKVENKAPNIEGLKEILQEVGKFKEHPEIKHSEMHIKTQDSETTFTNSEGSKILQKIPYGTIHLQLRAKHNSSKAEIGKSKRLMNLKRKNIEEKAEQMKKEALKKIKDLLKAEKIKQGKRKIIIDNRLAGLFAHEAMGHALEADQENSFLSDKKEEKIAPENFDLVSDPTIEGTGGFYKYDDEGVKGKKTKLIENGILKNFMHSRKTAGSKGIKSTGNGRAQSYSYPPIVRMNNTMIKNGETTKEEMVESIDKGLYIKGFRGGNVNTTEGEFRFNSTMGYRIEKGEIKKEKPLNSILLS